MSNNTRDQRRNLENRQDRRERIFGDGKVRLGDQSVDCIIFDISGNGARIGFYTPRRLPSQFVFEAADGTTFMARQRWQDGNVYGLEFVSRL